MSVVTASLLTVSGNEITDATRALALQGDGRAVPDSSFGFWPARTNMCKNGSFETSLNSGTTGGWDNWIVGGTGLTISRDATFSKFGGASLKAVGDGTSNTGTVRPNNTFANYVAAAPGDTWCASAWVWAPVGTSVQATFMFTDSSRTTLASVIVTAVGTGAWQRVLMPLANAPVNTAGAFITFKHITGNASTWWLDAVQVEQANVAGPAIPTDGATATRAAARAQAPAPLLAASTCWAAFRVRYGWASTATPGAGTGRRYLLDWRDDANNLLGLYFDEATLTWTAARLAAGAGPSAVSTAQTIASGNTATVVFACTPTAVKVSVNGGAFVSAANSSVPTIAAALFDIASQAAASHFDGDLLWAACGTGTLTDADAAAIAALPASPDPSFNAFPSPTRTAMTGYWTADTPAYWTIGPAHVVRDTINGWCSWGAYNVGLLSFDSSDFDSADVFGVSPLDATFGGAYDDISARLQRIVIRRGRNDNLTTMLAGDADVDLRDPTGIFNPDNAASPLYGQLEDRLHPIKIQSTYGGVTYPRMYMWVDKSTWQPAGRRGITQLHCIDLFYWLDGCFPVIASTGPTTTGAAIGKILDAAGATDPAMRDLDVGDTIPDFTADGSVSALDLIGNLLDAERGVFFVAATGKATYRSRLARLTKTSSATITDRMNQLNPGVDFNQLQTRVRVTRTQSGYTSTQVAAGSILQKRGYRDLPEISTPYLLSDSQADGLGMWVLSQVSSPKPPIEAFTIDNRDDTLLTQILQRELVDRITVHDTRGGTVGDFHIDSITETIDYSTAAAVHQAEWLLSRASEITPAEFDIAQFDEGAEFVY